MALTIEVTKTSVATGQPSLWNISLKLQAWTEPAQTTLVIDEDFTVVYRTGQDVEVEVKDVRERMQKKINDYNQEQVILTHADLDTAVTWLNANLAG